MQNEPPSLAAAPNGARRDTMVWFGSVLSLVGVFSFLNITLLKPWTLSPSAYSEPVILVGAIRSLLRPSYRSLALLVCAGVVTFRFRRLSVSWDQFEAGSRLRLVVGASALLLAWIFSTYQYNYFAGQAHLLERASLVVLALLSCWRPVFAGPFLLVLWPMLGQFNVLLGGFSWAIPFLPARVILLFTSFFLLGLLRKEQPVQWPTRHFFFALLCVLAGHYVPSGYGKLACGWLLNDQLHYMVPNTYANGWLTFLEPQAIDRFAGFIASVNPGLKVAVILAEVGAVFALLGPRTTRCFLSLWILFHIGVAAVSGIAFWPWVVVHLSVLVAIRRGKLILPDGANRVAFVLSVILIATAGFWVRSVSLSWMDSPANYSYRMSVVDENDRSYEVAPSFMAPFEYRFTVGAFHFLSPRPVLPISWGATNVPVFEALSAVASEDELLQVELQDGVSRYDQAAVDEFAKFLVVYFQTRNAAAPDRFAYARAPMRLWTLGPDGADMPDGPVREVRITQVLTATIEGHYRIVRSRRVLTVQIPAREVE